MLLDGEGAIVLLDREDEGGAVYDETGKLLRTVGPAARASSCRRPVDMAVDPFRNTYVADEERSYVFSPQGQLLDHAPGEEIQEAQGHHPRSRRRDPGLRREGRADPALRE